MPQNTKKIYVATQMEHDQLFCRGPDDFLLGPCPHGPHPGDGAGKQTDKQTFSVLYIHAYCLSVRFFDS